MELALEIASFVLNIGLVIAAVWLARIVSGSVFALIPTYLIVLALALTVHSGVEFVPGNFGEFLYGLTALIVSISYLLLGYGIFLVLKKIIDGGGRS